jgi:hypothetical protein
MVIATGIRIGIMGDYNGNNPTHVATTNGIQHASAALGEPIEAVWLRAVCSSRRSVVRCVERPRR